MAAAPSIFKITLVLHSVAQAPLIRQRCHGLQFIPQRLDGLWCLPLQLGKVQCQDDQAIERCTQPLTLAASA